MTQRILPPGVAVMTVGEARREFPDHDIGPALRAWGDSPAVPRDPDDAWCWVLEGGIQVRARFKTREEAIESAWEILWYVWEHHRDDPERGREIDEFKLRFLQERGWGFPEGYKKNMRDGMDRKRKHDAEVRRQQERLKNG